MTGQEMYERFIDELNKKGVTKKDFCVEVGISPGALSNWQRRGSMPSADMILKMAEYLGCSTDYLLGKSNVKNASSTNLYELTFDESELLIAYQKSDDLTRNMIIRLLAYYKKSKDSVDN